MSLCDDGCQLKHWRSGERALCPRQSKEQYVANMDDDALFSSLRLKLFTAVVGDVLDKLGWRRQFLPQAVGPLRPDMKIVGRAMPVLEADVFDEGSRLAWPSWWQAVWAHAGGAG